MVICKMMIPPPSPSSSLSLIKFKHLPKDCWLKTHCTSISKCKQAHAFLLRNSLFQNPQFTSKLISSLSLSLSSSGNLRYANSIFSQLTNPDIFIWNTLIRAHAKAPNPSDALLFFHQMRRPPSRVHPDHFTYPFVLTACARLRDAKHGMGFHCVVSKVGLGVDVFVVNSLIQMYANCGWFDDACKVFNESFNRDVVTWNAMITGFVTRGLFHDAFRWFEEMVEGKSGVEPDSVTVISLVSACAQLGDLERGRWLHWYSEERGFVKGNVQLSNAIVDMYCKGGDLGSARRLFDEMGGRDLLTWTSMISGLANSGSFLESLELFGRMQREGVKADEIVIVAIISACAQMGALEQGNYVHLLIERWKIKRDLVLETALVDMYAKCGNLECAMQVFKDMRERNTFTWNAMIGGLAIHGQGTRALELFQRMEHERVLPDDVTFIGLLSACSHSGLVDEGLKLFEFMKSVYQIEPRTEHYGCVVDLFGRAKLLGDALDFIERMPIKPNAVVWASLIGACRTHEDKELAERVVRRAVELDPDSCGRYVMLSNFYAGARRFDDALKVRNVMKSKGIDKTPGLSWIELNGTVHQFIAGDKSHYMTDKIYMMLEEMRSRVRSVGHVSGTSEVLFDIDEEEKDQSLVLHSEKLAVAFGLINTAPGSPIRIVKNLRVCSDCHSFLKAVSKVFGREIIARDRSRFHHFKDGLCSCRDVW